MAASPHPPVLTTGLGRRFGRQWAVSRIDLRVEEGEVLLLAGPNGSGKTTLLRLLGGLYRPSAGSLSVFGMDPQRERLGVRRTLSLVSHENYLYPPLTAIETLRIWARLLGRRATAEELRSQLEEVGLEDKADQRVGGFSAGMRKRLTLVRTRFENPRLVLLDEPLAALDGEGKGLVEGWIRSFREEGRTVVIASHALERMSRLCDRAELMERGQIVWSGSGAGLLRHLEGEP